MVGRGEGLRQTRLDVDPFQSREEECGFHRAEIHRDDCLNLDLRNRVVLGLDDERSVDGAGWWRMVQ